MRRRLIIAIIATLLSTSASGENPDSLVLARLFGFRQSITMQEDSFSTNVYMKHLYQTHKRNATLWAVPSMYTIAKGRRAFVSEQYSRLTFNNDDSFDFKRQVYYTTIPRNRRTMPVLLKFTRPDIYAVTMHSDHLLSPFNRENKVYYRYRTTMMGDSTARLEFRPRFVSNTQLVKGHAMIDVTTGRVISLQMDGEFDMISFRTTATMGESGIRALIPHHSEINVEFKFMGNHISSHVEMQLDCPITLPDTVDVKGDRQLIDSLRPLPLSDEERFIYASYDHANKKNQTPAAEDTTTTQDTAMMQPADSTMTKEKRHHNYLKDIGWDIIGANLLHSLRAETENGYVKLSPIINPQYISYSHRKGLSYRIKLGARYSFTPEVVLYLNPRLGYNFKLREFYWNVPVVLKYSSKLDAHVDFEWGNDNRIGSSDVLNEIREEYGDLPELEKKGLDIFDHQFLRARHSIMPTRWLGIETGIVYHRRHAINAQDMAHFGKPTEYLSLAPSLGLKIRPWPKAPLLSIDYERGLPIHKANMTYERWEADMSAKVRLKRMQTLNLRIGGGLYTHRGNNYFMDYSNFRDENLPEGWDDDWSGNFQLLSSQLYNASDYYVRGNISYESPLLGASLVPVLGRYVERERVYLSSLIIADSRLYSELGYSFTTRLASVAFFASFMNTHYREMGCKFTFELFRRW